MKDLKTYVSEHSDLKDTISEALFKDFFTAVKNQVVNKAKRSDMEIDNKKMSMEELIKYVNKNLKADDKGKDAAQLLKDVTEIVNKDSNKFENIVPLLKKWTELNDKNKKYSFDTFIANDKCTSYLQSVCDTLAEKYKWESFKDTHVVDFEDSDEEDEEDVFNTAFIAFILASLADNA